MKTETARQLFDALIENRLVYLSITDDPYGDLEKERMQLIELSENFDVLPIEELHELQKQARQGKSWHRKF